MCTHILHFPDTLCYSQAMSIQLLKPKIVPTLKRQGAIKIAIFGSFAAGKEKKSSDIDILVKFKNETSLFKLSSMKLALEDKTGRKVDLLTYGCINPRLKDTILKEQKVIYEKSANRRIVGKTMIYHLDNYKKSPHFQRALSQYNCDIPLNQSLILEGISLKIITPIRNRTCIHPFHSIVGIIPPEASVCVRGY